LLRLPYELLRKNFKSAQRVVERERDAVLGSLRDAANASMAGSEAPDMTLENIDSMIGRMNGLKRKLEALQAEEQSIHSRTRKRIAHLNQLYRISSLIDPKYQEWSSIRLNRLLVDFLIRNGFSESAKVLAQEKDIEELVDIDVFQQCQRIVESLRAGNTTECLAWCQENKQTLKKIKVTVSICQWSNRSH
jgi:macrophage erythroblast attacher